MNDIRRVYLKGTPYGEGWFIPEADHLAAIKKVEQQVCMEDDDYAYVAAQAEAEGRIRGWNEALDAAREAVERASSLLRPLGPALAAIDALRGEQK